MSFIGNVLWFVFGGFFVGLGYIIGGLLLCVTIIGIPWGIKAIQFGFNNMTPFGKVTVPTKGGGGCLPMAMNIIWLVLFGWEIAFVHLVAGIIFGITIIGIPFAKQHFKLIPIALLPFTYELKS